MIDKNLKIEDFDLSQVWIVKEPVYTSALINNSKVDKYISTTGGGVMNNGNISIIAKNIVKDVMSDFLFEPVCDIVANMINNELVLRLSEFVKLDCDVIVEVRDFEDIHVAVDIFKEDGDVAAILSGSYSGVPSVIIDYYDGYSNNTKTEHEVSSYSSILDHAMQDV